MKVLQMSASYHLSKLYKSMFNEFDQKGIKQVVYVALKNIEDRNKNIIENSESIKYVYSAPFKRIDSYFYYTKILKIYKDVVDKVDIEKLDLIHSHFLFSDGGVAYQIKKRHDIEYIVAVRNTDLNTFFKYGIHVRKYGVNILRNAKKIILISESYREPILTKYIPKKHRSEIDSKMVTLPNGIDNYWLNNSITKSERKDIDESTINLIYVGRLDENKNLKTTFEVMELLEKEMVNVNLKIIGSGPLEAELKKLAHSKELNVNFYGYIESKDELRELYRKSNIFIMPSIHETFGLVYIEAMSQGLPVIYTKNQGIHGYFKEGRVGYGANPNDPNEIKKNVLKIIKNYQETSRFATKEALSFNWDSITDKYIAIYQEILKEEN